jgi:hypothetical protein
MRYLQPGWAPLPYEGPRVRDPICAADGTISESDLDKGPFTINYPFTLRMLMCRGVALGKRAGGSAILRSLPAT